MRYCPNGHEVNDVVKFCPKCGTEIIEDDSEEIHFCMKCGHKRKGLEKFCTHCGYSFYGRVNTSLDHHTTEETSHSSSINKILLSLLIIVPSLLIGGFLIYNHIEEGERQEKIQIEKNEKAAKEVRERIEENMPQNKFFSIASQDYCWICPGVFEGADWKDIWPNFTAYLFFYPDDKNGGDVLVREWYDPKEYFTQRKAKVKYRFVNENTITFQFDSRWRVPGERHSHEVSFTLTVINDGDNIKLLRYAVH